MKAFRLQCYYPYNDNYEYVICEKAEDIENNIHSKLTLHRYEEIPLTDVDVKEINCQSLINLLNAIK